MAQRHLRFALIVVLVTSVSGCVGYTARPAPLPTPERRAASTSGTVRVTLSDGARYTLNDAYVQGDSLIGFTREPPSRRVAVAISAVKKLESYGTSWRKIGQLAGAVFLGLALFAIAVGQSLDDS
jgi:hypothetical protein